MARGWNKMCVLNVAKTFLNQTIAGEWDSEDGGLVKCALLVEVERDDDKKAKR